MKKPYLLLVISLLTATILCVFGQGIAYFLSDHVVETYPIYYLTGLTILGWILYLLSFIMFLMFRIVFKIKDSNYIQYQGFIMIGFISAPFAVSWSFFVVAMWWG